MSRDRRTDGRTTFARPGATGPRDRVFANKYIDGTPHAVELLDASASGLLVRRILEPDTQATAFALELSLGGKVLWAWTRRVWCHGSREALRIVSADALDRARLRKLLREPSFA